MEIQGRNEGREIQFLNTQNGTNITETKNFNTHGGGISQQLRVSQTNEDLHFGGNEPRYEDLNAQMNPHKDSFKASLPNQM